jgi:DNA polymerase-1
MAVAVWDYKGQYKTPEKREVFDTLLAEYLLVEGRQIPKLEETLQKYNVKTVEELAAKQLSLLADRPKLLDILSDIEIPLIPILCEMEMNGITVDKKQLLQFKMELEEVIAKTKTELQKEFGTEVNLSSPAQIGAFLAEKSGVPLSKTKTGQYATNENELLKHKASFPVIEHLLTYREITKLHSTYTDGLLDKMDSEDKIHTTYNLVGISTGRLSSTNPNLQNIPVASELGRHIKSCFTASPGWSLLSFDYSQQELRILAHLSEENKLIEAFASNRDIHRTTASQLFDIAYENVTNEQRYIAKTINFGIIYGMSSYGMSEGLQIPREDADIFIKNFYQTFPKIKTYYDKYLQNAKRDGYVETLLGRRRFVFNYPGQKFIDNATRRVLMNYPIQGTAAELMKMAMITVYDKIVRDNSDLRLLLQIHDELVFEVKVVDKPLLQKLIQDIKECMTTVYPLSVPMEVGVKTGLRWGDLQ